MGLTCVTWAIDAPIGIKCRIISDNEDEEFGHERSNG
jgi:hypothetical protein